MCTKFDMLNDSHKKCYHPEATICFVHDDIFITFVDELFQIGTSVPPIRVKMAAGAGTR